MAMEPAGPVSATTSRWLAFSGTSSSFRAPPNRYSCHVLAMSRQATRAPVVVSPRSPEWYLYATHGRVVVARTSCSIRFVPLKIVYCRLPENTPSVTPGKDTVARAPSVLTEHEVTRYAADARVISSGLRGSPGWLATPAAGGGFPPRPLGGLRSSGASQNGSHRYLSTIS